MPIYIKASLACPFHCEYCYEHPFRPDEQNIDYDAVEASIRKIHWEKYKGEKDPKGASRVGLHGGEPLFQDKKIVERLLKLCFELDGRSSIQTNGYLIDDDIIGMFKKYKTGVGVSVDGPWPLNELRGIGTPEERKKQTAKVLDNLYRLRDEDINASVIAVIHKKNALGDRREALKNWIKELHSRRITGRLNPCCCGNPEIDLTPEEAADFYSDMYDFLVKNGIGGWSPFRDVVNSLKGEGSVVCVFRECDPYHTPSCLPVFDDGGVGVCLRLYTDGKTYLRAPKKSDIRSNVLTQTDCKGCKWWKHCYGGCIGLSVDFDWRNKDRYCLVYKTLFERVANTLKMLQIKPKKRGEKKGKSPQKQRGAGGHTDGFEHIDGDTRHVDSGIGSNDHTDGFEHLDGDTRHLDSG